MGKIVVGVDGSEGSAGALRWAARESQLRGWPVTAVMAWGYLEQHHIDSRQFDPEYDESKANDALEAYVAAALDETSAKQVNRQLTLDLAARGLLDASADADLLVMGARGLGGFRGLLLGSVSQTCLHHAHCPVAIVREPSHREPGSTERIVVGIDGSGGAQAALDWALDEARARQASVDVVYGWQMIYTGAGYPYAIAVDPKPLEDAARRQLAAAVERADTRGLEHPVEQLLIMGGGTSAILDTAEGADLIVVGTRGVGGFRGMLLGSVSHHVAQHAPCPVVAVPTPAS